MWRSIVIINCCERRSKLFRLAVDLSSGGLLSFDMELYAPYGLLRYVCDRSKHLKSLCLVHISTISDVELIEVAGKIPVLEELDLSYCERISCKAVAAVGRLCPLLQSFKLNTGGCRCSALQSDDEAFAIAQNMSGLHHLQILGNKLTNVGLIAILDGCQQLESLDLRQCFNVNLDADLKRRCSEQVKHFRGPNDSTDDYPFRCGVCDGLCDDDDDSRSEGEVEVYGYGYYELAMQLAAMSRFRINV